MVSERSQPPPLKILLVVVFVVITSLSIGVTILLALPWYFVQPNPWSVSLGIILLAVGFPLIFITFRALSVHRAFGSEIHGVRTDSTLVTSGIYGYTRNPLYLSSTILFFGWTFLTGMTFVLIMTLLFMILFLRVAKWEEKELIERFGSDNIRYRDTVPFFIPYPKKRPE